MSKIIFIFAFGLVDFIANHILLEKALCSFINRKPRNFSELLQTKA